MDGNTWDNLLRSVTSARDVTPEEGGTEKRLEHLRNARRDVDTLLNETMAEAVVYDGASLRSVASAAGFADNAIRPRLAQTDLLSGYAQEGTVSISGVHRARHDYGASVPRYSREERVLAARVAVTASAQTGDPIPDEVRELAKEKTKWDIEGDSEKKRPMRFTPRKKSNKKGN